MAENCNRRQFHVSGPHIIQQQPLIQRERQLPEDISLTKEKTSSHRLYLNLLMILILVATFLYVVGSLELTATQWKSKAFGDTHLLLTPYINNGKFSEARELAKVNIFSGVTSYSGFLTVDENCASHLFFWFFPSATGNATKEPLILWHGGGPGTSALFALFEGTGPITLNAKGEDWTENEYSWTTSRSVLYLDSPVGTGFSYTEKGGDCFASSSDDVAESVVTALRQFFLLFPEFQSSEFYISSSSYGGKFIPMIARRIDNENELDKLSGNPNLTSINLKGLISMSGFSDPVHQIDYGEFYFNLGLINEVQRKHFQFSESRAKAMIRTKHYFDAYEIIDPLVIGTDYTPSYLKNATGIGHPYNCFEDLKNPNVNAETHRLNKFLNLEWVQRAIHVNISKVGRPYSMSSNTVYGWLRRDIYKSVRSIIEDLLDKGYKFLFTSGQFDLIVPHTTVMKFLNELTWDGGFDFRDAGNYWYIYDSNIVGYGKSRRNLSYIMFRNIGHHPFIDKPEWTQDVIFKFTKKDGILYQSS